MDTQRLNILLIDDSEDDALLLQMALARSHLNHWLYCVSDKETAIRYLSAHDEYGDRLKFPLPSVLLLDLGLGGQDGVALLEWIGAEPHRKQFKIVAVSDRGKQEPHVASALASGADLFVRKTSDFDEVVRTLVTLQPPAHRGSVNPLMPATSSQAFPPPP